MQALGLRRVAGFYLGLLAVGLAAMMLHGGLERLAPRDLGGWATALWLGAGTGALMVAGSRLLVTRFVWAAKLAAELRAVVGELGRGEALAVAVLSGFGEEVLFRGVLQPFLGLWLSALLFGMLHIGPNRHFWPWTLMAGTAGLIFGTMFMVTGNLMAPVLAHGVVNYLNLRYLAITDRRPFVELGPVPGESAAGRS